MLILGKNHILVLTPSVKFRGSGNQATSYSSGSEDKRNSRCGKWNGVAVLLPELLAVGSPNESCSGAGCRVYENVGDVGSLHLLYLIM